ncbi:MAG: phytanoyl-CoA dioxygenase family protein [Gammaproteobacteria bacterium]|nr:phytanoyl-CoA dioxygenase family protein [Gammaproteobacteria bacterium]
MPRNYSDKVTITLYSIQNGSQFNLVILDEINHILILKTKLSKAAEQFQRVPPQYTLSVLLMPDWMNNFDYESKTYIEAKASFFSMIQARLNELGLSDILLEDFYETALGNNPEYAAQKEFLQKLTARNRTSDLMKVHVIISNANCNHLQIDSNTQIHDYHGFYQATFGSGKNDILLLNAAYYPEHHVTAHNKVVYTTPKHSFSNELKKTHLEYCATHLHHHDFSEKHSVYADSFIRTLYTIGLVTSVKAIEDDTSTKKKHIFPAILDKPEYALSKYIVTVLNLQWKDPKSSSKYYSDILKNFPFVEINDAVCGYAAFLIAIKRWAGNIGLHKYGERYDDLQRDRLSNNLERLNDDTETREQLFRISGTYIDKIIIQKFYYSALRHTSNISNADESFFLMQTLAKSIPNNLNGNILTSKLFGCSVIELHGNPFQPEKHLREIMMTREKLELTPSELHYRDVYCQPNHDFQTLLEMQLGDDFTAIVTALDQNGIVALPQFFSGEKLSEMQEDFNKWCSRKMPDVHAHIQFGGTVEEEYLTDSQAMCDALANPLVWAVGAHAWGRDPVMSSIRAYRILPTPPKKYRAFQPHNDGHSKEFKVMMLLTDVKPGEQGMRYWTGTHKIQWQIHSSRDTLFTDSEVEQLHQPFECAGPAGTLFIFNINGIHSGVRNEGSTRDTLVWSISAGKRMYPVPALHPSVIANLGAYEAAIFRCGKESNTDEVDGEIMTQQSAKSLQQFLTLRNVQIRESAQKIIPKIQPQLNSAPRYDVSPFAIPQKPTAITLNCELTDFNSKNELSRESIIAAINEDPRRGMALPIRLYSGSSDKSRDMALCFIRDIWLSPERGEAIVSKIEGIRLESNQVASEVQHYQKIGEKILTLLPEIKPLFVGHSVALIHFENFIIDLQWCLSTAETHVLVRSGLSFLLSIIDFFSEHLKKNIRSDEKLFNNLNFLFNEAVRTYIVHIQLDILLKNETSSEKNTGIEFKKYTAYQTNDASQLPPIAVFLTHSVVVNSCASNSKNRDDVEKTCEQLTM